MDYAGYTVPAAIARDGRLYFRKDTKLISIDGSTLEQHWEVELGDLAEPHPWEETTSFILVLRRVVRFFVWIIGMERKSGSRNLEQDAILKLGPRILFWYSFGHACPYVHPRKIQSSFLLPESQEGRTEGACVRYQCIEW